MANRNVRFTYPPRLVDEPVLYQLVCKFDVVTNLYKADVNLQGGMLELSLRGDDELISQALAWVRQLGIKVEELPR